MSDSNPQFPPPPAPEMRTLSIGRQEIDERDPTLRIMPDGGNPYTVLLVQKLLNIGSEASQEIALTFPGISKRHARLMLEGSNYRIYDLGGTQGVLVNGQAVDTRVLRDGDTIRLQDAAGRGCTLAYSNPIERAMGTQSIGKMFPLDKFPFILGRDPAANLKLEALAISWHHAEITQSGEHHILRDLGSTNGTFVNDRQITGAYRLQMDDVIRIDKVLLVYKGVALSRLASVQKYQLDAIDLEMTYRKGFPPKPNNTMRNVSLSIQPKEFVAIIGGSGSGKSTLLRALNGANRATGGKVLVNGDDLYAHYGLYQPIIGYVPQADIVQDDLTVDQALKFGARLRFPNEPPASREQRITRVLESLELTDFRKQLVRSLSGGQKKRVSIALELMAEPALLFMDEPSSGLDPGLDKSMMETLRKLADRGHIVAVVTHTTLNIDLCDELALMARGNLAYYGPPKDSLAFFGVRDYPEIYNQVFSNPEPTPEKVSVGDAAKRWADRFKQTPQYVKYITSRIMQPSQQASQTDSALSNKRLRGVRRGTFMQQARVLTERTMALALHDLRTLAVLLLVLPMVGLFLASIHTDVLEGGKGKILVSRGKPDTLRMLLDNLPLIPMNLATPAPTPGATPVANAQPATSSTNPAVRAVKAMGTYSPANDAQRLLFMMALAVTLLGIFASAYTIVAEKSLFLRERMVNLRIAPYLTSKVAVYGGLSLISCILLLVTVGFGVEYPAKGLILPGWLELFVTLALTALAGVSIGLLLSSLVRQVNAVTYAVLAVLFLQILFPGVLFKMDGALEPLSRVTITRWSLEALGGTADMVARNSEGQFVVSRTPVNPKTGEPLKGAPDTKEFFPSPSVLSVTYPTQAGELLVRWAALLAFSVIFLVGAGLALNRSESF